MSPLTGLVVSWIAGAALLAADGRRRAVAQVATALLLLVTAADVCLLLGAGLTGAGAFETTTGGWPDGIGIALHVDGLGLFFAAVSAGVLTAVMHHESRGGIESRSFPALLLLMCAGLHGAFFSGDLFNFYVFFELSVMTSFALAIYGYGRAESRGAFVYMTVNLIGSVVFLGGVAGVYHAVGTLDFELLRASNVSAENEPLMPAVAALLTALAVKLGLFPFHGWVPVLYRSARPPVAAALAGALVNIGAYGLLRLAWSVFPRVAETGAGLILGLGAAAVVYGAVLALGRRVPAEIAAYLAITQAGYVMLGLGLSLGAAGPVGVAAALLAVIAGAVDKTGMFLALDGGGRPRRFAAFWSAAGTASLPLTLGFVAKALLFHASLAPRASVVATTALLLGTPLIIAAAFRFFRLVGGAARPPAVRPGLALYAVPAIGIALGAAPDGLGRLVSQVAETLLGAGP